MMKRWMVGALIGGWLGMAAWVDAQPAPPATAAPPPVAAPLPEGPGPGFIPDGYPPPSPGAFPPFVPAATSGAGLNTIQFTGIPEIRGPVPGENMSSQECCAPPGGDPGPCLFGSVEYLRWFLSRRNIPTLLTQGDPNDTVPGGLGQPGTLILLDQQIRGHNSVNGGRVSGGIWLAPTIALQGSFFGVQDTTISNVFSQDSNPNSLVLARPFFNVNVDQQDSLPLSFPNFLTGNIVFSWVRHFYGGEANVAWNVSYDELTTFRFTTLFGARYINLDEKLRIHSTAVTVPGVDIFTGQTLGSTTTVTDEEFNTYNRFYGGQAGGQIEYSVGPARLEMIGKVAVGATQESVKIKGSRVLTQFDGSTIPSGSALLAGPGNIGTHHRSEYCVVPELDLNLNVDFNDNVTLKLGYSFLYLSQVVRPRDILSPRANIQPFGVDFIVGPSEPAFSFRSSSFWAHGLNAGIEVHF